MELRRTTGGDPDFLALIEALDRDLWERYPDVMQNYTAGNVVDRSVRAVVLYESGIPVGCGCLRPFNDGNDVELKRMFVEREYRGAGRSKAIVGELEAWARELGFDGVRLETGRRQPEAIGLYESTGFSRIESYGDYVGDPESLCYRKSLR